MYYTGCFFNWVKISRNTVCACGFSKNNYQILLPLSHTCFPASRIREAHRILFPMMKTGKCGAQTTGESVVASARTDLRRRSLRSVLRVSPPVHRDRAASFSLYTIRPPTRCRIRSRPRPMDSIKKISRFTNPEMIAGNTTLLRINQQKIPVQKNFWREMHS